MKSPRFFKVILQHDILHGKLLIPKKFAVEHGSSLPSHVQVKVRNTVWKMKVRNEDGDLWLLKGWKEFADYYSLSYGHFLVFKHKGNGLFHVIILGTHACEIDYTSINKKDREKPPSPCLRVKPDSNDKHADLREAVNASFMVVMSRSNIDPGYDVGVTSAFAVKYLDGIKQVDVVLRISEGKTWNVQYIMSGIIPKLNRGWKTFVVANNLKIGDVCIFEMIKDHGILFHVIICRKYSNLKPQLGESKHENHGDTSGVGFFSKNPFFEVVIQPYSLKNCCINIPVWFVKKHLKEDNELCMMTILQSKERSWPVKLVLCKNERSTVTRATLSAGWSSFARENSLELGDVCGFELVDKCGNMFKVSMVRRNVIVLN